MHRIHALILSTCALAGCQFDYAPCDGPGETSSSASIGKACPDDSICFDVKPMDGKTVRAGHIVVMWSQLNEADPDPDPEIAFDARIDSSSRRIVILSREV